jgi:Tfp pilus assembly PilM family ATPase
VNGFRARHSAIAVDIGTTTVAVCQLERKRADARVARWGIISDAPRNRIDPGVVETPHLTVSRASRMIEQVRCRGRDVICTLKPPHVQFIPVRVPEPLLVADSPQRKTALAYEAARETQCNAAELLVDGWELPRGGQSGENFMVAATRRDWVESLYRTFEEAGLYLCRVDVQPLALTRSAWRAARPGVGQLWGVLDIGRSTSVMSIAIERCCVYVRALTVTGEAFTDAICNTASVEYAAAESLKTQYVGPRSSKEQQADAGAQLLQRTLGDALDHTAGALANEVERAWKYVMQNFPDVYPHVLYVCGGGSRLEGLAERLEDLLGIRVMRFDASDALAVSPRCPAIASTETVKMGVCTGAAVGDFE